MVKGKVGQWIGVGDKFMDVGKHQIVQEARKGEQQKSMHSFDSLLWYPPSAGFARLLLLLLFFSRAHGSALFQLIREGLWSSEQWGSALLK